MKEFQPIAIICNLYPEVDLNTRIANKALMYAQLQCQVQPGSWMYFKMRYMSRNEKGELKHLARRFEQLKKAKNQIINGK